MELSIFPTVRNLHWGVSTFNHDACWSTVFSAAWQRLSKLERPVAILSALKTCDAACWLESKLSVRGVGVAKS